MKNRCFFAGTFISFGLVAGILIGSPLYSPYHNEIQKGQQSTPETCTEQGSASARAEERTADYTYWLDFWTAGLVFVAVGQAIMFLIQLDFMRRGMADTKLAADAAKESSDLARDEFNASHRPRLRVSNIAVRPNNHPAVFEDYFLPNHQIAGTFYVTNVGDGPALITGSHVRVFLTSIPLPMRLPYEGSHGDVSRYELESGATEISAFRSEQIINDRTSHDILHGGNQKLYVMGWVTYEDRRGVPRKTMFCRKYDAAKQRFFPVDDPDYEREE